MKFEKQSKGWILEEIEKGKKQEVVIDQPIEEVEKEIEENEKEMNKRFKKTIEDSMKVKEEDHEEKAKVHEEFLKTRKELSEAIASLKEKNIKFKVSKSTNEEFRYVLSYEELNEEVEEPKEEKLVEETLPDAIPEEPIVVSTEEEPKVEEVPTEEPSQEDVENGVYLALSGELRDTLSDIENLKSLMVTLIEEEGQEDIIDSLTKIIEDRTNHANMLRVHLGLEEEPKEEPSEEIPEVEDEEEVVDLGDLIVLDEE